MMFAICRYRGTGARGRTQALDDALNWRTRTDRACAECGNCGDELCDECSADWAQVDRYHELARALGAVGDTPAAAAQLAWSLFSE